MVKAGSCDHWPGRGGEPNGNPVRQEAAVPGLGAQRGRAGSPEPGTSGRHGPASCLTRPERQRKGDRAPGRAGRRGGTQTCPRRPPGTQLRMTQIPPPLQKAGPSLCPSFVHFLGTLEQGPHLQMSCPGPALGQAVPQHTCVHLGACGSHDHPCASGKTRPRSEAALQKPSFFETYSSRALKGVYL